MGQYYKAVLYRPEAEGMAFKDFDRRFGTVSVHSPADHLEPIIWDGHSGIIGGGLKLMEHSYVGNAVIDAVVTDMVIGQAKGADARVFWWGDYTERDDVPELFDVCDPWTDRDRDDTVRMSARIYDAYALIDMDLHEYVIIPEPTCESVIHPLPLLTCTSNGRGGGDYRGVDMDYIGRWKGHRIHVASPAEAERSGMYELDCEFQED